MSSENQKREKRKGNGDDDESNDDDSEKTGSVQKKGVNYISKEEEETKRREFQVKNKWNPDHWLVWYLYGPPKCGGHLLFTNTEMQHLTKIKAARKLTEEEEIVELRQANNTFFCHK